MSSRKRGSDLSKNVHHSKITKYFVPNSQLAKVTLLLYQYLTTGATFLTISLVCVYFRFLLTSIVVVDLLSKMAKLKIDPPSWDAVFAGPQP